MLLQQFTNNPLLIMTPEAERFNGWAAMLGFVAAVGAYVTTGQIIQAGLAYSNYVLNSELKVFITISLKFKT